MKNTLIMTALVASLVFAGCSKDDEKQLTLSNDKVSLNAEETEKITASSTDVTWESENTFVAKVSSSGLITGNHVGKTTVTATSAKEGIAKCAVEVTPKFHTYTEPVLEFGATMASIKSKESRTLSNETSDGLTYKDPNNKKINGLAYLFEKGKMTSVGVFVKNAYAVEAVDFLAERYLPIDVNGQNYDALFVNNAIDKADMLVIMDMDTSATLIMYAAYSKSKSRSLVEEDIMINQFKQMFKGF